MPPASSTQGSTPLFMDLSSVALPSRDGTHCCLLCHTSCPWRPLCPYCFDDVRMAFSVQRPIRVCDVNATLHANFDEMCGGCGIDLLQNRLWCSGCACAVYCSPMCQKNAWPSHKTLCTGLASRVRVVPTAVEAEIIACIKSTLLFPDDTRGVLQLLDGCSGIESFKWQFVRLENTTAAARLRDCEAITLPRQLWCAFFGCELWCNLLRVALSAFIDAQDGCYRGAACFPVTGSSDCATLRTRMLKRDLTREQMRLLKTLGRRLQVRFLALMLPRGFCWHDRLAPLRSDGMRSVVTLVTAGRIPG